MADYSLKKIFGGKDTEAYQKYKAGQKAGKWSDYGDYQSQGGSSSGGTYASGYQDLISKQKAEEDAAISGYESVLAGQPSVESEFGRIGEEYGLGQKRDAASDLLSTYNTIAPETTTMGKNFGMSSSQIARRIQSLQGQQGPQLQEAQRLAQEAGSQTGERLNYAWQDLEKQLRPFTEKFDFLKSRLQREATGYTNEAQNQFNLLLNKIQNGQAVTAAEQQQTYDLAKAENQYVLAAKYDDSTGSGSALTPINETPESSNAMDNFANSFQYTPIKIPGQQQFSTNPSNQSTYQPNYYNNLTNRIQSLGGL